MTDDEIRDVFPELERIGVELSRPPGLALGTGFRDGEFLTWLRTLPNGLGHDAFVERLQAHLGSAQPTATAFVPDDPPVEPRRWWPTQEQLEAGIDVLIGEWDPLGARLGQLSRDDVGDFAYDTLVVAVSGDPSLDIEERIASLLGGAEEREFGVRASPLEQRLYLARRLIQVVVDHPAARHELDFQGENRTTTNVVGLGPRDDEPPALRLVRFPTMDDVVEPTTAEMRIASLDRLYEELRRQRPRAPSDA